MTDDNASGGGTQTGPRRWTAIAFPANGEPMILNSHTSKDGARIEAQQVAHMLRGEVTPDGSEYLDFS